MNTLERFRHNTANTQQLQLYPIAITKAYAEYLEDEKGNTYLDLLAGSSVANLGYGDKEIIETYCKSSEKLNYTNFHYTPTTESAELAEKLFQITPGKFDKKILFGLSGSDAIEGAIKCAQQYTNKKKIINFKNSYHGAQFLSYLASDFSVHEKFRSIKDSWIRTLPFPATEEESFVVLEKLQAILKTEEIAGVLIEPIQGDGGNLILPKNFLFGIKGLCEQYNTMFIVDEVLTGAGRSGKWFAIEHENIEPDLLVIGKGFGAGYVPFSAVVGKKEILDSLPKAAHVSSYFAHPPTCSVVLKVIEIIEREKILEKTHANGQYFRELVQKKLPEIKVRGLGWINGIKGNFKEYEFGKIVGLKALNEGIYCGYFGVNNNTLRVHPPLTISKEQTEFAAGKVVKVIEELGDLDEKTKKKYLGCSGFQ